MQPKVASYWCTPAWHDVKPYDCICTAEKKKLQQIVMGLFGNWKRVTRTRTARYLTGRNRSWDWRDAVDRTNPSPWQPAASEMFSYFFPPPPPPPPPPPTRIDVEAEVKELSFVGPLSGVASCTNWNVVLCSCISGGISQTHRSMSEINFVLVSVPSRFSLLCGMRWCLCRSAMLFALLNFGSWVPCRRKKSAVIGELFCIATEPALTWLRGVYAKSTKYVQNDKMSYKFRVM